MLLALAAAATLSGCEQKTETSATAATGPPPAVTVISVQPTAVTPGAGFNGRVVAVDDVQLRARVTGFLEQRRFEEGADVETGELLFVIEKAPYQAVVDQRQAELASAEANRVNTAVQLRRGEELVKNKNIPQAEVDERRAADEMAAAGILEAQAALERAQIDLGYTEIHTPIAGRIGRAALSVGNLVGPDSGVLATIVSQDPIYVTFPVSQRQLLEYRRRGDDAAGPPVVKVTLPDGTAYEHPGEVNFFDVQVDQGTDTVTVRAAFPNPDRTLVDGQFVNVRVRARRAGADARGAAGVGPDRPGRPLRAGGRRRQQGGGQAHHVGRRRRRAGRGPGGPQGGRQGDRRGHPEGATRHNGGGNRSAACRPDPRPGGRHACRAGPAGVRSGWRTWRPWDRACWRPSACRPRRAGAYSGWRVRRS